MDFSSENTVANGNIEMEVLTRILDLESRENFSKKMNEIEMGRN
jgi:hypothetical protein